jgi:hypothetical protein
LGAHWEKRTKTERPIIMRIQHLGQSQAMGQARRTTRSGKSFSLGGSSSAAESESTEQTGFLQPLSSFVITQDEDLPLEQKRQQQGRSLLNTLKNLQRDLMLDRPSPQTLSSLKQQLEADLSVPNNPQLQDLLQQIELRARVEIAKYGL